MQPKWWDFKNMPPVRPDEPLERTRIRQWLSEVPHGAIVGNMAMLLCYDEACPEKSYVIIEGIQS